MKNYKTLGVSLSLTCVIYYGISLLWISTPSIHKDPKPSSQPPLASKLKTLPGDLTGQVELTVRLSLGPKEIVNLLMCSLFRSAGLFWDPKYGNVLIILDKEDASNPLIDKLTSSNPLPFNIRFVYEDPPVNVKAFQSALRSHSDGYNRMHAYGYNRMLYSSFLMDLYTNVSIIAWSDTDTMFTIPVIDQLIARNGKLIVTGYNIFGGWVRDLDVEGSTVAALGLKIVANFMTYFPIYIFPSTIKNCREHIMRRLNVPTFEEAYIRIASKGFVSPVILIMSYAYYFERERYDWHINTLPTPLAQYNKEHLPGHELLENDTIPEFHQSYHYKYVRLNIDPLERVLCFLQIYLGGEIEPHCISHKSIKFHLFEFETNSHVNHFELCKQREGTTRSCEAMTKEYYTTLFHLYQTGQKSFTTMYGQRIDNFVQGELKDTCRKVTYINHVL